jgi:hypothetical protein
LIQASSLNTQRSRGDEPWMLVSPGGPSGFLPGHVGALLLAGIALVINPIT